MKLLLLLALLGAMAALAAAQTSDPRDFELLEMTDDEDDVNENDMAEMRSKADSVLKRLTYYSYRSDQEQKSIERARGEVPLPPGYTIAMNSGLPMFSNATTEDVPWDTFSTNANTTTTTTTTTPFPLSADSQAMSRGKRQLPTNLYYCPHQNYLLVWFIGSGGRFCFVPWAWNQAITYARCPRRTCSIRLNRRGRCRPSCYQRRYIFARCWSWWGWQWRWEVKNLAQACRCSTC